MNKGFTMVELLAVMVILGILTTLSIGGYSIYESRAKNEAYDTMASSAADAAKEYSMDYPGVTSVTLEELKDGEYLSSLADPSSKGANCRGLVGIEMKDSSSAGTLSTNSYNVHICCSNYNYTYKIPGKVKTKDKYCKADYYDITKIQNIDVLNVYPVASYKNYFSNWMNSYGKNPNGKQVIHVTPVYIDDFNNNPDKYLRGNTSYDIIVFGFADCNGDKDLSDKAYKEVDSYLTNGGSAIFGHDTITTWRGFKNFVKLRKYVGMRVDGPTGWNPSNKVTIKRKGVFTEFPYKIGNVGTTLTIPQSHVSGQVVDAGGDVWLTFNGIGEEDKSVYLSTYGNNAFIQTGHSGGAATPDEQKILANIIFYTVSRQYTDE